MNFGSASLTEENIVHFWRRKGLKVNFYGDETWLRLFPEDFHKWDAVTSLFVADFIEVDDNVTRHLDQDLALKEWDVLILHYLGLDHIGHLEDPNSHLIKPKLQEMDSIIRKIHNHLKSENDSYAIVVCGDHGMGDAGGHGGASYSEIMTSLMVVSDLFVQDPVAHRSRPVMAHQVDLASTLALLTGIEIPRKNVGRPINQVLKYLPLEDQLTAHYRSSRQLLTALQSQDSKEDLREAIEYCRNATFLHDSILRREPQGEVPPMTFREALQLYDKCEAKLSHLLRERKGTYNMNLIGFSIFLLTSMFFLSLVSVGMRGSPLELNHVNVCILALLIFLSILASLEIFSVSYLLVSIFGLVMTKVCLLRLSRNVLLRSIPAFTVWTFYILSVAILHPASLLATSFIEEEHQTHYFVVSLSHFLLLVGAIQKRYSTAPSSRSDAGLRTNVGGLSPFGQISSRTPSCFSVLRRDFKGFFSLCHSRVQDKPVSESDLRSSLEIASVLLSWLVFRLVRSFNATGDKWKHLEDLNDTVRKWGPFALRASALTGSLVAYSIFSSYGSGIVIFVLAAVYLRHSFVADQPKLGVVESQAAYSLILVLLAKGVVEAVVRSRSSKREFGRSFWASRIGADRSPSSILFTYLLACLSLLFLLLQKPENILAASLFFLHFRLLFPLLLQVRPPEFGICVALWLSQAHFFAQGNSNSLTTVQISAGFVGVTTFAPVIHGVLIAFHTFGAEILLLLHFVWVSVQNKSIRCSDILELWWLAKLLLLCVFTTATAVQRHHLFIWSVFAPKLLYEGCHFLVLILVTVICHGLQTLARFLD